MTFDEFFQKYKDDHPQFSSNVMAYQEDAAKLAWNAALNAAKNEIRQSYYGNIFDDDIYCNTIDALKVRIGDDT